MTKTELLNHVLTEIASRTGHDPEPARGDWTNCHCPAHDDRNASLGVKAGDKRIILKCQAGCDEAAIAAAIGMTETTRDGTPIGLFYEQKKKRPPKKHGRLTVEDLANAKGLPVSILTRYGVLQDGDRVRIQYFLADGSLAPRQRLRLAVTAKDGSRWEKGDGEITPYGLQYLNKAREKGYLVLVEGESDCWSLWSIGVPALGIPGASNAKTIQPEYLDGIKTVYAWQEPDKGGASFIRGTYQRLTDFGREEAMRVCSSPDHKDPNAMHQALGAEFHHAFRERLKAAEKYVPPAPPAQEPPARTRAADGPQPSEVAEKFLADAIPPAPPDERIGVIFWRDRFFRWTGQAYTSWPDGELRAEIIRWIRENEYGTPAVNFVGNVVENIRGIGGITFRSEPPAWLNDDRPAGRCLCLTNGILDIGKLLKGNQKNALAGHSTELFSLNALPFAFDANAACPQWLKFLNEVLPDQSLQDVLQEWFGYCLVPSQQYQRILLMLGAGANGKSIVTEILSHLIGEDNCSGQPLESIHEKHSCASLVGKLVNFSNEFGNIKPEGEGILKAITGGDIVNIDQKFKDAFDAKLYVRFTITSNNPPRISDRSEGLWRRFLIIPFDVQIPEEKQIPKDQLIRSLSAELSGILTWSLIGLERLVARGRFEETEATRAMKAEYRTQSNSALAWCDERLEITPNQWVTTKEAYADYREWCKENGIRYQMSNNSFGREVHRWRTQADGLPPDRFRVRKVLPSGDRAWIYDGVCLVAENGGDDDLAMS